ncbi:GNAT family N-acetyltransferase [Brenneria sp. 4F2]|nr:GNAT family N-acetyltransferase [Brenneria bubanii]
MPGDHNPYLAILNGRIVGSVAIDGEDLGNNEAHLRWFILNDGCRGSGAGRKLIAAAMKFCDKNGFSDLTRQWWLAPKLNESPSPEVSRMMLRSRQALCFICRPVSLAGASQNDYAGRRHQKPAWDCVHFS